MRRCYTCERPVRIKKCSNFSMGENILFLCPNHKILNGVNYTSEDV